METIKLSLTSLSNHYQLDVVAVVIVSKQYNNNIIKAKGFFFFCPGDAQFFTIPGGIVRGPVGPGLMTANIDCVAER